MKKNKIIFLICILLILVILIFILFHTLNTLKKDNSIKITETNSIVVQKLAEEGDNLDEKKITNSSDINEIIKIIENKEKMPEDEIIPYRKLPHYRLKLLDKNDSIITEINFFYYSSDSSWISFDNDELNYLIDADSLLKILDF